MQEDTAERSTLIWPVWGIRKRTTRYRKLVETELPGLAYPEMPGSGQITRTLHSATGTLKNPTIWVRMSSALKLDHMVCAMTQSVTIINFICYVGESLLLFSALWESSQRQEHDHDQMCSIDSKVSLLFLDQVDSLCLHNGSTGP